MCSLCVIATGCALLEDNELPNGAYIIVAGSRGKADFNDVVKFYCDGGYELTGPILSRCTTDGWTHADKASSCIGKVI